MKLIQRLRPDTLVGRLVLVLLSGLVVFQLASFWLQGLGEEMAITKAREIELVERLVTTHHAMQGMDRGSIDVLAHSMSTSRIALHWTEAEGLPAMHSNGADIATLRQRIAAHFPDLMPEDLRLGYEVDHTTGDQGGPAHVLLGALKMPGDGWLMFTAPLSLPEAAYQARERREMLLNTAGIAAVVLLLGLVGMRLIGQPLRLLSEAADRFGGTDKPAPLQEKGPREVRIAAQAFNRMQRRIDKLITDRTLALAAVSHDLRTPLTRLRLRAGSVENTDVARAIDADLDEMEAMISSTLTYLRDEDDSEPRRPVDLVATLQTLCDNAADSGADATYSGPDQARLICRPLALKRALSNLLDNALKYGERATISLIDRDQTLRIDIADAGPGLPDHELDAVFEPFRRLELSRNRVTGGSGLGLSIARQVVEHHGGTVTLANRPGGGLVASVILERRPAVECRVRAPGLPAATTTMRKAAASTIGRFVP